MARLTNIRGYSFVYSSSNNEQKSLVNVPYLQLNFSCSINVFLTHEKKDLLYSLQRLIHNFKAINQPTFLLMETEIRPGKTPYVDKTHFPEGFNSNLAFTEQNAEQLTKFGETLVGLECGIKFPQNQEERSFVAFCKGNKSATTELERLWEKYRGQIRKMRLVA